MELSSKSVAVVGSGPAALMAADVISAAGAIVSVFEKRKSTGRKLLIAGSSGLNITNSLPLSEFIRHYSGSAEMWERVLHAFTPQDWIRFIESLGMKTFEGTSGRYFIEDMKASKFLLAWNQRLAQRKVQFQFDHECVGFEKNQDGLRLSFSNNQTGEFDAVCFGLGGGSWEPTETPLRWPSIFKRHRIGFEDFTPSNVGYQITWPEAFLKEAEGKPLKNVVLSSSRGSRKGDAMITKYGMEGTPVYFVGQRGKVTIDLKPDLSVVQIMEKLRGVKENLSPIRRVKKQLNLCPASFALLFHCTPAEILAPANLGRLAEHIKALPLLLGEPQPLTESISSAGGLRLDEIDENFMLKNFPGVFVAGEMLDWDVPTGGFLIQGCVSQGYSAGQGILRYLRNSLV